MAEIEFEKILLEEPRMATENETNLDTRAARFRPAEKNEEMITDMSMSRKAVFRPNEHIAARRDLIESFVDACKKDSTFMTSNPTAFEEALLSSAFAEEALGRFDRSWRTIGKLDKNSQSTPEVLAMRRRLARSLEEEGLVQSNLEKAYLFERGTFKALSGLELAQNLWKANASVSEISNWLDRVVREFDVNRDSAFSKMSNFIASWLTFLSVDVALLEGDVIRAAGLLELLSEHPELTGSAKRKLRTCAATWFSAVGELGLAKDCFEALDDVTGLEPDTEESYLRIMFDLGDRDHAAKFVRRHPFGSNNPRRRLVDAMILKDTNAAQALLEIQNGSSIHARASLDLIRHNEASKVLLIDALNANLQNDDLSAPFRVALLCELSSHYEQQGSESEAADVLREALELLPDHAPAIRSLGRLYHRTGEIEQLVNLYENEIAARIEEEGAWRRRFQVAQLYETDLHDLDRALGHYVAVLKQLPNYLPALKGASRICESTGQWARIAGLFLEAVPHTKSERQRIYLLDKVANLAEHHLSNDSAAIDAWEEILSLMPEHPNAHASLGRLYFRNQRWHDLIDLNLSELNLIDDKEEVATLFTRNGELAEFEICDSPLAEKYFRRALAFVPDFLPALEGLGRILTRTHRWEELVAMNRSQLDEIENLSERYRQTIILAEIFETRLRKIDEAENLYRYASTLEEDSGFARLNYIRLKKSQQKWDEVYALELMAEVVNHGYLGYICEWKKEEFGAAYAHYLHALHGEPSNLIWLDGLSRTWTAAGIAAGTLADDLENLLLSPMDAECRDAYFLVLARLREFEEKTPEASRAYRAHGDRTRFENRAVLRLSMGLGNETQALIQTRRCEPLFENESLFVLPRKGMSTTDVDKLVSSFTSLEKEERDWLLRETEISVVANVDSQTFPLQGWLGLSQQFGRLLSGEEPVIENCEFSPIHRFLGLESKEKGDIESFRSYIDEEIHASTSVDLEIRRRLELTKCVPKEERDSILKSLVGLYKDENLSPLFSTSEKILQGLEGFQMWKSFIVLGDILLEGEELKDERRTTLLRRLAEIESTQCQENESAAKRYLQCWEASNNLLDLQKLVDIAESADDLEQACQYQQLHFGEIRNSEFETSERTLDARLVSGMKLAELLFACERASDAIHLLEEMTHPKSESLKYRKLISYLGKLHASSGDARRSVSLLEEHLPISPGKEDLEDWNVLVSTYLNVLHDVDAAYRLQWKLVRALSDSREELEKLVDIAVDLEEVEDCCDQLEKLADTCEGKTKADLLFFVAQMYEEELFSSEESVRIYGRLLTEDSIELDDRMRLDCQRQKAFALSRVVGQEQKALHAFRNLVKDEVFEPSTYRGMVDLFTKLQAFDRARCSEQILRVLGCDVNIVEFRAKQSPSREAGLSTFVKHVFPSEFSSVFGALRALMPLAEKVWGEELPQRKAMSGERLKGGRVLESLEDGFAGFGIKKFRAIVGDAGPLMPQVIPDGTVWFNSDLLENSTQSEIRFYTAYAAAIGWSDISSVLSLDGRELWHLLEGIVYKQSGQGFSDRIDAKSQDFAELFSSAFYAVARRRIVQAMDTEISDFSNAYCEAWPKNLQTFAIRYAVAICGDVYASVSALLKMNGWEGKVEEAATQSFIRRDAQIQDLLSFVNSNDYYELRYSLGLSGKPSLS